MIFGIVTGVIALLIILGCNYLLPWQIPLFRNRQAIIEYVHENHPESKIFEEHIKYRASGYVIFFELIPDCYITFEENDFQYRVFASSGKVSSDNYSRMKLWSEVRSFINDGFLEPRGIDNVKIYCEFDDDDGLPSEWSEYSGDYKVVLSVYDQGNTPQKIGWLYDFYRFWKRKMPFSEKWQLNFEIYTADERDGVLNVAYYYDLVTDKELYAQYFKYN